MKTEGFANVVRMSYKSAKDLETATDKSLHLADEVMRLDGIRSFTLVRTGEAETTTIAVYGNEESARSGQKTMLPKWVEKIEGHVAGEPQRQSGAVIVHRT